MEKKLNFFDRMMIAITFAEAGEPAWEDKIDLHGPNAEGHPFDAATNGAAVPVAS